MKQIIIALILLSTASAKAALVQHWAFDETTGSIASNSVSGGTDGTIETGVGFVSGGKIENAYEFDETTDSYVDMVGYNGILGPTSRTVNIWLNTDGVIPEDFAGLLSWGINNVNGGSWELLLRDDGTVSLDVTGYRETKGTSTVTNNMWRMFTVVSTNDGDPDIRELKIYIDGTNDPFTTSDPRGINTRADYDVRVGRRRISRNGHYNGLLDDPAIWDEPLTPDEITCLYDAAQEEYNAYYFDQLKQVHDAGTGSTKLDEWWDYASGLTGSPGLNTNSVSEWFIFDGAAGTGVRLAGPGTVFRFK